MSTSSNFVVTVLVPVGAEQWVADHLQTTFDYALGRSEDAVAEVRAEAAIVSQETKEDTLPTDKHLNRRVRVRIKTR
jgi:hypothetical protein